MAAISSNWPTTRSNGDGELNQFRNQVLEVDEEIRRYKDDKRQRFLEDKIGKLQDLHQLRNYNPWGKPGAGAPKSYRPEDNKRQKFREEDMKLLVGSDNSPRAEADVFPFNGGPGGGAPLRTNSGRVKAEVPGDPLLRFQGERRVGGRDLTESLRYRLEPGRRAEYAQDLEKLIAQQVLAQQQKRMEELQTELRMLAQNSTSRDRTQSQEDDAGKSESGANQKSSSELDIQQRPPPSGQSNGQPTGPTKSQQADEHRQQEVDLRRNPYQGPMTNLYFPFGSSGGGAPNRDTDGNVRTGLWGPTALQRSIEDERKRLLAARLYHDELEHEMIEQRLNQLKDRQQLRAPFGNLSEIMSQGQVGRPRRDPVTGRLLNQHLPSSDVTNMAVGYQQQQTPREYQLLQLDQQRFQQNPEFTRSAPVGTATSNTPSIQSEYMNDLARAAQHRARMRQLDKLRDLQADRQHVEAFGSIWGRPGAGAPNVDRVKKTNLHQMLYYSDRERNEFKKTVEYTGGASDNVNFVRNNVRSDHANFYEYPDLDRSEREAKRMYNMKIPYALAGESQHE